MSTDAARSWTEPGMCAETLCSGCLERAVCRSPGSITSVTVPTLTLAHRRPGASVVDAPSPLRCWRAIPTPDGSGGELHIAHVGPLTTKGPTKNCCRYAGPARSSSGRFGRVNSQRHPVGVWTVPVGDPVEDWVRDACLAWTAGPV